jgi:DNA-binding NtrC family response regulator
MTASDTVGVGDFETVHLAGGSTQRLTGATTGEALDAISVPARATLADAERILITEHLARAGTKTEAARTLGIGLRTLYTKIHELHLAVPPSAKRSSARA